MHRNPITLAFTQAEEAREADFLADYYRRNRSTIRWSLFVGLLAYMAFGFLDRLIFPESTRVLWLLRFGLACPVILLTLLATFLDGFERIWAPALAGAVFVAGGVIVVMTLKTPSPLNQAYYAGGALVLVYGYALSRLRFIWASIAGLAIVLLYEVGTPLFSDTPPLAFIANSFFFVSTNLIGMAASYAMEYHARKDYLLAQELDRRLAELRAEQEKVRVLRGLIPICSHCRRIRDDKGYWSQLEEFLHRHSDAALSHGICPECARKYYSEYL